MIEPIEIKVTLDGVVIESFWTTTAMDKKEFEGIARKIPAVKSALAELSRKTFGLHKITVSVYSDAVIFLSEEVK